MTIADKAMAVTGANRGIGQTLVAEAPSKAKRGWTPAPTGPWPTRRGGSRS
jgi:NAD(P)-dependent dehydrogenase (short-subunit alcohol dehydrogenase family)